MIFLKEKKDSLSIFRPEFVQDKWLNIANQEKFFILIQSSKYGKASFLTLILVFLSEVTMELDTILTNILRAKIIKQQQYPAVGLIQEWSVGLLNRL